MLPLKSCFFLCNFFGFRYKNLLGEAIVENVEYNHKASTGFSKTRVEVKLERKILNQLFMCVKRKSVRNYPF